MHLESDHRRSGRRRCDQIPCFGRVGREFRWRDDRARFDWHASKRIVDEGLSYMNLQPGRGGDYAGDPGPQVSRKEPPEVLRLEAGPPSEQLDKYFAAFDAAKSFDSKAKNTRESNEVDSPATNVKRTSQTGSCSPRRSRRTQTNRRPSAGQHCDSRARREQSSDHRLLRDGAPRLRSRSRRTNRFRMRRAIVFVSTRKQNEPRRDRCETGSDRSRYRST